MCVSVVYASVHNFVFSFIFSSKLISQTRREYEKESRKEEKSKQWAFEGCADSGRILPGSAVLRCSSTPALEEGVQAVKMEQSSLMIHTASG